MKYLAIFLLCLLIPSCRFWESIEYRSDSYDKEYYISLGEVRRKDQDPKLGPKGKLWLTNDPARLYLAGSTRRKRLTLGIGMIYYFSEQSSLELGYRSTFYQFLPDERRDIDFWNETPHMFFIGGRINW
jgi:hypothetical protein